MDKTWTEGFLAVFIKARIKFVYHHRQSNFIKTYLALIQNQANQSSDLTEEATFEYYKQWGKYLAKLNSNDALIKGSLLNPTAFSLAKNGDLTPIKQDENPLKGYLLLQAETVEELKNYLLDCPVFDNKAAKALIHEIDLTGKI